MGFKKTVNRNKYKSKARLQRKSQYLDYLIDPSFQGAIGFLLYHDAHRTGYKRYILQTVEIKDYNVVIDGKNFFDLPVKNDQRINDNIRKIVIGQVDDYTTCRLLDYVYFKNFYKVIPTDLRKQ